jgi:hypothetical protein
MCVQLIIIIIITIHLFLLLTGISTNYFLGNATCPRKKKQMPRLLLFLSQLLADRCRRSDWCQLACHFIFLSLVTPPLPRPQSGPILPSNYQEAFMCATDSRPAHLK